MITTPVNTWPIAEGPDPTKQYPAAVDQPFKTDLDTKVVMRFASAAARDTAIPTPVEGMTCWLADLHQQQTYMSGKWAATAGILPGVFAGHNASFLHWAGWQPVTPTADAGALGWGGWAAPTSTAVTVPAGGAGYLLHFQFSCNVVQAGIKVTPAFGRGTTPDVIGTATTNTAANTYISIAGTIQAVAGTAYNPLLNAGSNVDVTAVMFRVEALQPR